MPVELFDTDFCYMELLSPTESRLIRNKDAKKCYFKLSDIKMVEFDGFWARLLPDGVSALEDYREVCKRIEKELGI